MPFSPDTSPAPLLMLRCARIVRGLRLQDLADAADISVAQLSLIERGKRRLTPRVAEAISRALGEGRR